MSLYSSIQVSRKEDESSTKRSGFVPLYAEASEQTPEDDVSEERQESTTSSENKSNAALQFAPLTRRKPSAPVRKKQNLGIVQDARTYVSAQEENAGDNDNKNFDAVPGINIPRLDVINTFDDFADYQPEYDHGLEAHKRQKKNKRRSTIPALPEWEDEYDPSRPVDFETYLNSTYRQDARQQWLGEQERLGLRNSSPKTLGNGRPTNDTIPSIQSGRKNKLNFAPIIAANVHRAPSSPPRQEDCPEPPHVVHVPLPPSGQPLAQSDLIAETADEAYQRRAALSSVPPAAKNQGLQLQSTPSIRPSPPPPPPPPATSETFIISAQTTYTAPPTFNHVTPVQSIPFDERVALADSERDLQAEGHGTQQVNRSSAPGQKGFAARYMASQGWKSGQGLGSTGSGRLAPLFVKPQKDGKTGKIIDRHKHSTHGNSGAGHMTRVVLLEGMIEIGAVVDEYLQQDVGESCSEAYGKVERVVLQNDTGRVFVKFTQSISALRCVSTVEGRQYDGKQVSARYYPEEAFETGDWKR